MHKKYRKRLLSLLLVVTLTTGAMYTEYHTAQEVQAIAVVDDIAVILAILAACGAGYVGYEWYQSGAIEDFVKEVQVLDEKIGEEFDNSMEAYIASEWPGYDPNDFDPDNDDPNEKPPKWEKLKLWAKAHPGATLALGAGGAMATVVTAIMPEILKTRKDGEYLNDYVQNQDLKLPDGFKESLSDYPYYFMHIKSMDTSIKPFVYSVYMCKEMPALYKSGFNMSGINMDTGSTGFKSDEVRNSNSVKYHVKLYANNEWYNEAYGYNQIQSFYIPYFLYQQTNGILNLTAYSTNIPIYEDEASAISNNVNPQVVYPGTINPLSLPLSTDIKDWLDQNPGKDAPEQPLYDNVKIPTQDEVDTFIQDLDKSRDDEDTEDEKQRQTITNNFIQNITNVNPDPAPDPDPDPGPTPDPDPEPDPNPDPSPDPPTDLTDEEKGSFLLPESIKKKFPFCIPFDLIDAFTVLKSDTRQAPRVKWHLQSEKYDIDYTFDIDMSVYNEQAELLRTLELLLFIVGLILATRSLIRG